MTAVAEGSRPETGSPSDARASEVPLAHSAGPSVYDGSATRRITAAVRSGSNVEPRSAMYSDAAETAPARVCGYPTDTPLTSWLPRVRATGAEEPPELEGATDDGALTVATGFVRGDG